MKKIVIAKLKNKKAQALPEFAICLPLIILILGMIITIGQLTYAKQVLQTAAEVGCRVYVDGQYINSSNASNTAQKAAKNIIETAGFGVEFVSAKREQVVGLATAINSMENIDYTMQDVNSASGVSFKVAQYTVTGKCATLFPLTWKNEVLRDNDGYTFLQGSVNMLVERTN